MIHLTNTPINDNPTARYIVMSASACMPSSCWGVYGRVAVVEVEPGARPHAIDKRARGVVRVVETWERLNVGRTDRCAFDVALAEAVELAARLNGDDVRVTL